MFVRFCRPNSVHIVNLFKNCKNRLIMPPKKRNAADTVEVQSEEAVNGIPKKRGRKVENVEVANGEPVPKTVKQPKKTTAKATATKSGKTTAKAASKTDEKAAKVEEKVQKKTVDKKAEKAEDSKGKPKASSQKPGPSGDKTEAKNARKATATKAKTAAPSKSTKKAPKAQPKPEDKPALLNTAVTKWDEIDFDCQKQNPAGEDFNIKITSWNVDGIRAWVKKGGLNILKYDNPDILCLQETKCSDEMLPAVVKGIAGYHDYWCSSDKLGYAGVGVYSKKEPLNIRDGIDDEQQDGEGRCLTLEFTDFYLVNVYVPNAGRGLQTLDKRLKWNIAFKVYIEALNKKKDVILCGDMNVAHNEIDLANPKSNKKNAGFTQEERDGMTEFLGSGFVDTYRALYPEQKDVYTFWSYITKARLKNVGWRLDYFIISEGLTKNVCDCVVRSEVYGSDHCPISLFINL